jgi:hypothetical protein
MEIVLMYKSVCHPPFRTRLLLDLLTKVDYPIT